MTSLAAHFTFSNGVVLKNRVVMAPMTTYSGEASGHLSEDEYSYYAARSHDVGMVITGTSYTVPNGKGFKGQFYAGSDDYLPGLTRLAKTLKANGAKAVLQIFHAGRMSQPGTASASDVVSASAVAALREKAVVPRALEPAEVHEIIASFVDATMRAIAAGFDGVEIHGANTYLIQQFHSPHSNRRSDEWGGDAHHRMNFPLAVTEAVLAAVSKHAPETFLVGYRISPEELEQPGLTLNDTLKLADRLADLPLDYLHLSLRQYDQTSLRDQGDDRIVGRRFVEQMNGRLPVIGVGSIISTDDALGAQAVGYGLIALGSVLIADPRAAEKILDGDTPLLQVDSSNRNQKFIPEPLFKMMLERPVDPRLHFDE
jgi:2,4-dienoyl-CoA reductase-like NADH-dependent reductase (Old Yellow Enzyme family)